MKVRYLVSGLLVLMLSGCVSTPTQAPETNTVKAFKASKIEGEKTFEGAYMSWQACVPGTVEFMETDTYQVLVTCKTPHRQELAMQWTGASTDPLVEGNALPHAWRLTRMVIMRQFDQEYSGDEINTDVTDPYVDALIHNQPL